MNVMEWHYSPDPSITFYVWLILNDPELTQKQRYKEMVYANFETVIGLGRPLFDVGPDNKAKAPKPRKYIFQRPRRAR